MQEIRKQRATGRTRDGASFPLSIAVNVDDLEETDADLCHTIDEDKLVYRGVVWVFANISGLVTFLGDGTIHSINENFSLMLFGYKPTELIGKVRLQMVLINNKILDAKLR